MAKIKTKQIGEAIKGLDANANTNSNLIEHDLASVNLNVYSPSSPTDYQFAPVDVPEESVVDTTLQDLVAVADDAVVADEGATTPELILEPNSDPFYPRPTTPELILEPNLDPFYPRPSEPVVLDPDLPDLVLGPISCPNYPNPGGLIDPPAVAGPLVLIGTDANDIIIGDGTLYGYAGNDTLFGIDSDGGEGDDILVSGYGDNHLTGGAGSDLFHLTASNLTGNNAAAYYTYGIDTMVDFISGVDKISLLIENYLPNPTNFEGLSPYMLDYKTHISADEIVQGAGAVALDANDFIIFDSTTGSLYYDSDGNGAGEAVQFAILNGVTHISADDFLPWEGLNVSLADGYIGVDGFVPGFVISTLQFPLCDLPLPVNYPVLNSVLTDIVGTDVGLVGVNTLPLVDFV